MKYRILAPVLCLILLLAACGGSATSAETKAPQTTAAPETTKAEETVKTEETTEKKTEEDTGTEVEEENFSAEEQEAAEDDAGTDEGAGALSKEQFIEYFDMLLADAEGDKNDFFVEYDGKQFYYKDLGDLYDVAAREDGCIDVKIMGDEDEEMLDFGIMADQLAFMKDWDMPSGEEEQADQELIDRFYGDWHGVVQFKNCTGKYIDALGEGEWVTSIARIYIDSDGYVIPFIGLHVEDTPIEDLEGELDTDDGCIYLSGSWISVPFENIPLTEENGTLHCEIPISKEAGSVTLVFNFRHLNDTGWTNEDPALPEDYIVNCQGWSFDQLAESNGYTSWDYVSYSEGEEPEYPTQIAKEEEAEDFGKTMADADGVVSEKALQEGYNQIMDELDKSGHDPVTYEFARDAFGADGTKHSPAQWNEGNHVYEWHTEDESEWVTISFTVYTDGSERLNTVNQSEAILNGR